MDNVTHTLVGAAIGEAGLKKFSGLAMPTLMIAANLPDLDVLAIPFGDSLTFRRGWTHGPLSVLVLPALLTLCMVAFDRWQARRGTRPGGRGTVRPWPLFALSLAGFLTHPFLDWLNNYGIRLLMPFSHEWFYGDAIFIIDPWIWLALSLGIFLSRRAGRRLSPRASRPSQWVVGIVTGYIVLMILGSRAAGRAAEGEIVAQGLGPVERLMTGPVPLNSLQRQIIYESDDAYGFGTLRWRPALEVDIDPQKMATNERHPAVQEAVRREEMSDFLYWSRFPFFEIEETETGVRVHAADARYARRVAGSWARVAVDLERPRAE